MSPGEHPGLPMAEYLQLPALSAGILHTLDSQSPAHAWFCSWLNPSRIADFNDRSDTGSIAHSILLEGSEDCVCVIDPNDHPAEKTGNIPDGWTNKSIRTARDAARCEGKIPVLAPHMVTIRSMVGSAQAYIGSLRTTEPAIWAAFYDGGESELTMLWDEAGTLCRLRADRISADRAVIIDPKFCASAHPNAFGRQMATMGYAISGAWYRRGVKALTGVEPDYLFLAVEQEPPHLCSLIGIDPAWRAYGDAKVSRALRTWRECAERGVWPGYPARAAYPEIPAWLMAQAESGDVDSDGIPYDISRLFEVTT
jgi:hypothetical protein